MLFTLRIILLTLSFTLSLTPSLLSATAHANPSSPSIDLGNATQISIIGSSKTSPLELSRFLAESTDRANAALSSLLAQSTDSLPASMETHIPNPTLISLGRPKVLIRSLSPVRLTLILTFDFGDA